MSSFCISDIFNSIWQVISNRRTCLFIFVLIFFLGAILGVVFGINAVQNEDAQLSQNTYVIIVINSNFVAVFFRLLLHCLILCVALIVCSFCKWLNYAKFLVAFVAGIMLGNYIVIAIHAFGLLSLFIVLLYFIPEQIINLLSIFLSYCSVDDCSVIIINRTDFITHNKLSIMILFCCFLAKLLLLFTILQIFLAII